MKKLTLYILIALIVIGVGVWAYSSQKKPEVSVTPTSFVTALGAIPAEDLTQVYENPDHAFSFRYPEGYVVTDIPDPEDQDATILLVQNASTKVGFQLRIQPIDEDISVLTVERIKQDLPDLAIESPQDVILGEGAQTGKGVAFLSDDPAFDGKSREIWFVLNQNLYQIRTYAAYDPLVQVVLGTWAFK